MSRYIKREDAVFAACKVLHQFGGCKMGPLCPDNGCSEVRDIIDTFQMIEIPKRHGRLIDADALHTLFEDQWDYLQVLDWNENPTAEAKQSGINWCINTMHDDAPTIIPADESDMDSFIRIFEEDDEEDGMDSFIRIFKD